MTSNHLEFFISIWLDRLLGGASSLSPNNWESSNLWSTLKSELGGGDLRSSGSSKDIASHVAFLFINPRSINPHFKATTGCHSRGCFVEHRHKMLHFSITDVLFDITFYQIIAHQRIWTELSCPLSCCMFLELPILMWWWCDIVTGQVEVGEPTVLWLIHHVCMFIPPQIASRRKHSQMRDICRTFMQLLKSATLPQCYICDCHEIWRSSGASLTDELRVSLKPQCFLGVV